MLTSRVPQLLSRLDFTAAAAALGAAAVSAVGEEMLTGYARPVYRTGALLKDLHCAVEGSRVTIGNSLPYATPVHEGTCRMPGRPYLQDGILNHAELLRQACAQALRQQEASCLLSYR